MKISTGFYVFLIALSVFSSCKKSNSGSNPGSSALPKTYTETITSASLGNSSTVYNLSYDNNNRITSLTSASSSAIKTLYQYNNGSFTMDLYENNVLSVHEIFFINSSLSLVDSTFQYNNTGDTTTEKYAYNSSKQLLTQYEYVYSTQSGPELDNTTSYTYDNNGNAITVTDDYSVIQYTYSSLLNTLSLGQLYLPQSKYLIQTTSYSSGGPATTVTDSYTFDSNNRVSIDSAVASNGDIVVKKYTY